MRLPVLATLGLAALAGSLLRAAQAPAPLPTPTAVYQTQCFALDRLEPADRTLAAEWLEAALDREGLYTLIGGLKPISTGIHSLKFDSAQPDLAGLDQARRIAAALSCGGVSAFVHIFAAASGTERFADVVLVNQPALDHTLREHRAFFAPLGLTPGTPGLQVMAMIDHLPREQRYRGLGHLFGFPNHAVDFFVEATVPDKPVVGPGKDRDFFSVPVFRDGTNYFVWAVPLGHTPLPADTAIVEKAAPILKSYRERRAQFIGPGKSGAAELLRDWLCDNTGMCAADRALQRLSTTLRSPDSPLSRASQLLRDRKPAEAARLLKELASQPMDDESARRRRLLSEDAAVRTGDAAWLARLSDRPDRYWFANGYLVFTAYGYMRASDLPAAREYLSRIKDTDRMDDRERRRYHSLMARIAQLEQKPAEELGLRTGLPLTGRPLIRPIVFASRSKPSRSAGPSREPASTIALRETWTRRSWQNTCASSTRTRWGASSATISSQRCSRSGVRSVGCRAGSFARWCSSRPSSTDRRPSPAIS